ncbi:hypothetical protein [Agromyces aerolatus]|uniref:hypothetical protein n=1 Tax=Agromyces sp. LY-1074 TaxID=3074080 RepID=UPI00285C2D56|nr:MULTISPECIES: hypothetical protein [unclassified Agromyces]MDR5699686.1 hypothetical protein [Agromyces sp. LY-1074]MDR5705982.1 hypothetical protein [Agromyces sp. LY-1358]
MRTTPLFAAAAAAYAANCALGASVALRIVDTRDVRWVHHAMYVATASLTALAVTSALWGRPRRASRRGAAALLPAAVPLAAIPYAGTHTRRHPVVALTAAPFFVAGILASRAADGAPTTHPTRKNRS